MNMNKKSLYIALNIALLVPSAYAAQPAAKAPASTVGTAKIAAPKPAVGAVLANNNVKVDLSVRYVNTMEAMQMSEMGTEASVEIDAKRQDLAANIQKQAEDLKKAEASFKSKESTLSASARNTEEAKIAKMSREFENSYKATEDELKLAVQQVTDGLFQEVEKAVTELAIKNNYDIVSDIYTGRTIYASPKAMITGDLVKSMDKSHKLAKGKTKAPVATVAA